MKPSHTVAVLIGSLRRDALSRRLALALQGLAPNTLMFETVEIGALPLYNPDLDADAPLPWQTFRQAIASKDAVLFVTPEYNRSVPAALKNALDVGSRPYGSSVWDRKPAAVVSQSPGAIGGFGANHHLRQSLVFLNMPTLAQPEIYLSGSQSLFDDQGRITRPEAETLLRGFIDTFADWIDRHRRASAD